MGESRSIDSRRQANMSNNSHSVANVYGGDDNFDKKSPEVQISALKAIKSTGSIKERKTLSPHKMLVGDNQVHVNASNSFD